MYQESARIGATLRDVVATLDAWGTHAEVIVVDDGSTDGSGPLVERIARELADAGSASARHISVATQPRNTGKGAAVRRGLIESRGSWVLMMDADNSAALSELPKLAASADRSGSGFAVGSRNHPDSEVKADPRRKLCGLFFCLSLGALGLSFVKDTQCGFKLYRRDAADLCARHGEEDGFAFDIEHIGLCHRAGLGVDEVGIRWTHREGGSVRVIRDGLRMLRQAVRIRARLRRPPADTGSAERKAEAVLEIKPIADRAPRRDEIPAGEVPA